MRRATFAPPAFTVDNDLLIGQGTFGKVYHGTLTDTKTPVCVKVTTKIDDGKFVKEAALLGKLLNKRAIIQIHGFYDGGSAHYIVLERADGALEHLLRLPRHSLGLPTNTILDLCGDLANALEALFVEKIAHRDIKPLNILYFHDRTAAGSGVSYKFKLCDFGEGRSVHDIESSFHTAAGTYHYMAPEMLARYCASHRSLASMNAETTDLWSLGITLFRCVTGTMPFDPRPFNENALLKMLRERPNNKVISYRIDRPAFRLGRVIERARFPGGWGTVRMEAAYDDSDDNVTENVYKRKRRELKSVAKTASSRYEEHLHSPIHPRWFLETMTLMIQFLLYRQNSNGNAILMGKLARLKSRVVYNLRQNVFCIGRPQCQFDETNDWFMEQWLQKPDNISMEEESRVCLLNEGTQVRFLDGPRVGDSTETRPRSRMTLSMRSIGVPGDFLIACERPIDRMRNAPPAISKQELKQIEMHFSSLPAYSCAAVVHYDLLALQMFVDNIHRLSSTIDNQRNEAVRRLRSALDLGQRTPNPELRNHAVWTFQTRLPEEFRIADDVQEATIVIHNCQQVLNELEEEMLEEKQTFCTVGKEEERRQRNKKIIQEFVAMTKYIVTAQRNLQEAIVNNCQRLMSSLRRIVEFNELADNLEAAFNGQPLPHEIIFVQHKINNNDLRYETPPGNVPRGNLSRAGTLRRLPLRNGNEIPSSDSSLNRNDSIEPEINPILGRLKNPKPKKTSACRVS